MAFLLGHFDYFKVVVGSWRSADCPGRILMLINYTLFFLPFSNFLKTTNQENLKLTV